MNRLLILKRRRDFKYYLGTGLVFGLSKDKGIWIKTRSRDWWSNIVNETFDNEQWIENFRITRETFNFLCDELKQCFPVSVTNVIGACIA